MGQTSSQDGKAMPDYPSWASDGETNGKRKQQVWNDPMMNLSSNLWQSVNWSKSTKNAEIPPTSCPWRHQTLIQNTDIKYAMKKETKGDVKSYIYFLCILPFLLVPLLPALVSRGWKRHKQLSPEHATLTGKLDRNE